MWTFCKKLAKFWQNKPLPGAASLTLRGPVRGACRSRRCVVQRWQARWLRKWNEKRYVEEKKRRLVSNQTIFDRSVIVAALISEMKLNSGRPVGISAPFAAEKVRDGCDSLFACFHVTLRIVRKMKSRCNSAVRCRMQVMEGRFPSQEDSIEQQIVRCIHYSCVHNWLWEERV